MSDQTPDRTDADPQDYVEHVVNDLAALSDQEALTVRDLTREFGAASFATLILVISVLLVSPLSGVPFFSSLCGLTIALIATQAAWGRDMIWLPERLLNTEFSLSRLGRGLHRLRRFARWLDGRTSNRLTGLVSQPLSRGVYALCALAAAGLPFMELVPLSSSLIGLAIALVSVGLLAKDGLLALIGLVIIPLVYLIPIYAVSTLLAAS